MHLFFSYVHSPMFVVYVTIIALNNSLVNRLIDRDYII
jgi:hypothetical protein